MCIRDRPWADGLKQFGDISSEGCCTHGWLRVQDGAIIEIAIMLLSGATPSLPRPPGAQCTDNGLDVNPLSMIVGPAPDDSTNGELDLYGGPSLSTEFVATVPPGTWLNVVHRCEINADGINWWMLDWRGSGVWGAGDRLVPYERG